MVMVVVEMKSLGGKSGGLPVFTHKVDCQRTQWEGKYYAFKHKWGGTTLLFSDNQILVDPLKVRSVDYLYNQKVAEAKSLSFPKLLEYWPGGASRTA